MTQAKLPTEDQINKQVVAYLRYKNLPFNHSPNEGKRSPQLANYLKAMGMSPGFPDLFIYKPCGQYHGLAIELKRDKGGRLSPAQAEWLDRLNAEGYRAVCCKGYDAAISAIEEYLKEGG